MWLKKHRNELLVWARSRPDILLWWQDECWFSRFAQPNAYDWGGLQLVEREPTRDEVEKALACYGADRDDTRHKQPHPSFSNAPSGASVPASFTMGSSLA